MASHNSIPSTVSDILQHVKDSDNTERIILPFTRYQNVFCAPNVVDDIDEHPGAPFHLLKLATKTYTRKELKSIFGSAIAFGEPNEYYNGEDPEPTPDPSKSKFVVSYNTPDHECVWFERLYSENG